MPKFNEELLQFIWQHKLLKPVPLITNSGREISILKPGELNKDAGPDFFNAQVRIQNIVLVGNIEIHIQTTDWIKHGHRQNKSYDNLILHAVYEHNTELEQNVGNNVEVLELKQYIDPKTLEFYNQLQTSKSGLPCAKQLSTVDEIKFLSWMERMTIERLEEKVERIDEVFTSSGGDYTQTFYTCLLRNFGFKVNALPFELISKQLPVQLLLKHSDNLLQLEAMLLGISGMLETQFEDKYIQNLQNEFEHLKNKYKLNPLKKEIFKFSKLRPSNFPTIRLAQLAMLIHLNRELLTNPQAKTTYADLIKLLRVKLTGYWKNHFKTDGNMLSKELSLGQDSAENIIINTFAPFFFFYSKKLTKPYFSTHALELLNACKMESNAKTKLFEAKKKNLYNAGGSQGIVNLYDNYCVKKQCLKCGIAASILKTG